MKKLLFFYFILISGVNMSAKNYDFVGSWYYSDPMMAAENSEHYDITNNTWQIRTTISTNRGPSDSSATMDILSITGNTIKTKVTSTYGLSMFNEGEIIYWKYSVKNNELTLNFRRDNSDELSQDKIFIKIEDNKTVQSEDFYGEWFWIEGESQETFILSPSDPRSDFAILEVKSEYGKKKGYALFEIKSYENNSGHIQLYCLESSGSLEGFYPKSKWYLSYSISDDIAYFAFDRNDYPEKASYGPYKKQ